MGRECPTNEEFGPGWGHVWVEEYQSKMRPGRGAVWVENVQQMKNLAPEGSPMGRIIAKSKCAPAGVPYG
jgi:hypothetical protein